MTTVTLLGRKPVDFSPYDILPKEIDGNMYSSQELKHDEPHEIVAFNLSLYYPLYHRDNIQDKPWRWVYKWQFNQFKYSMHMIENRFYLECYQGNLLKHKK